MPFCCAAFGCSNRFKKDSGIRFYRFPKSDLLKRKRWIIAVRRANFTPSHGTRICSAHFITGAPSKDPKNPDYAPSVFVFNKPANSIAKSKKICNKIAEESGEETKKKLDCEFTELPPGTDAMHVLCHDQSHNEDGGIKMAKPIISNVVSLSKSANLSMKKMKLALIQLAVTASKVKNLDKAEAFIRIAAQNGADLVCLPEYFSTPYGIKFFRKYAEDIPGISSRFLSRCAKENNIHLVGGSLPESKKDKLYNTCLAYGPDGELLAKFRKVHLSDIDIPGKISFQESSVLSSGSSLKTFEIGEWNVGLGICYDIRFASMASAYAEKGCQLLLYPGAFNMTTGPAHWELLQRARAVDNQLYVATISPARDDSKDSPYVAWGHSSVISPWGDVIATTDEKEGIIYCDIDISKVNILRASIPILKRSKFNSTMEDENVHNSYSEL